MSCHFTTYSRSNFSCILQKIFCLWSVLKYVLVKQDAVFKTSKELEEYLLFHQIKVLEGKQNIVLV